MLKFLNNYYVFLIFLGIIFYMKVLEKELDCGCCFEVEIEKDGVIVSAVAHSIPNAFEIAFEKLAN